jgi:hypothetical protein
MTSDQKVAGSSPAGCTSLRTQRSEGRRQPRRSVRREGGPCPTFGQRATARRDRRKDALLQQNGYFVLRFLTEDAGKRLDQVLDTILGALIYRENNKRP